MSRMIAAMADASYNKSVFHIERYQENVAAKSHVILNRYDALLAQENEEDKCKKLQEEANEKTAQMLREAAADTLDKVLYELSGQMKMPMPDRMRKQSSRWKLHDLNEEKGKQQILQKSLLFLCL